MQKKDILKRMIKDQWEIDCVYWKKANLLSSPGSKDRVGLLTEIGELANEVNSWKYWRDGKYTDKNKASEELGDCIAFTLTLLKEKNKFNHEKMDYKLGDIAYKIRECEKSYRSKEKVFLKGQEVAMLLDAVFYLAATENYQTVLIKLFEIGFALDMSFDSVVKAYYRKRNINIHREKEK